MEGAFKTFFTIAVIIFCLVVIGIFLIIVKVILLFQPEVHLMGLAINMLN
ncbi:MAG: hypothetical protein WC467_01520 [Patescibacteria group bacterium]